MQVETLTRRSERLGDTVRKLVRRGARANLSRLLAKIRPEDVAVLLEGLTPGEQLYVFEIAVADYPETAGELVVEMDPSTRLSLFTHVGPARIAELLESMPVDDAVAVVDSLPKELRQAVLEITEVGEITQLQAQLTYGDHSAGRIMTSEFFSLPEATTVQQAIAAIQGVGEVEMIFYLYIVDRDGHLVGVTSMRQLLLTAPDVELGAMMNRSLIKVTTETDQEEVARLVSRYDLLAIPVVDETNRLVGIITVDDIIGILEGEADEDFYKLVGTSDDELLYQEHSWRVAGIRLPWLLFNLVGLVLGGIMLHHFQATFKEALILQFFVPVIMGMGGNIGSQTSTITVRGLATGRIGYGQAPVRQFLARQLRVGLVLAIVCSIIGSLGALALTRNPVFAVVVAGALVAAILLASFNGAAIPILFQRIGIDPAIASTPLVTTSSDIAGILLYFGLAGLLMEWLLA